MAVHSQDYSSMEEQNVAFTKYYIDIGLLRPPSNKKTTRAEKLVGKIAFLLEGLIP